MHNKLLEPSVVGVPLEPGAAIPGDNVRVRPVGPHGLATRRATLSEEIVPGLVVIGDAVAITSVASLAIFVYVYLIDSGNSLAAPHYIAVTLLGTALLIQHLAVAGAYRLERLHNFGYQIRKVVIAWTTVFALLVAAGFLLKISAQFSRVWLVSWYVETALVLLGMRLCIAVVLRDWIKKGHCFHTIALVGAGELGQRFSDEVAAKPGAGLRIAAVFDDRATRRPSSVRGVSVLGSVADLVDYARHGPIDMVVIALPLSADQRILALIRQLRMLPVDVHLLSDSIGFHLSDRPFARTAGIPTINVAERPISGWSFVAKRTIDMTVASVALLALMPFFALIAVLIKLDSPGPVLFRQLRLGFNNNTFSIYKLRTMRIDAIDQAAERLVTRGDSRVTRIGRLLRRTSFDELPQLWNVLIGDMSLVGPRPHPPRAKAADKLYHEVVAGYAARHRVKPGITGWAQVNGWRGETDTIEKIQKRIEHDLYYLENWSIEFDLRILAWTLVAAITAKNAY
jgi:Undecaprenyl-phosphate glucose phosphotransferase